MLEPLEQPENVTAKLELIYYTYNDWKLNRYRWVDPSEEELNLKIGDRVFPAGEDVKGSFILKSIKAVGERFYPEGGYVCSSFGADRSFNLDAVIKHPEEIKKIKKLKKKK